MLADAILLFCWPWSPPVDDSKEAALLLVATTGNFSPLLVDDRDDALPLGPATPPLEDPPAARRIVQFNETRQLGFFDLV